MKLSIIIPAFNEENTIKKAISSVINSSYKNFELIIVDNGSTDKTKKIIKSFNDKRIKYYFFNKKKGPAVARNYGISKSKGDYLFFLDADDWLKKETLNVLIKSIKNFPSINAFLLPRKNIFKKNLSKIWSFEFFSYVNEEKKMFINKSKILKTSPSCPYIFNRNFFNKKLKGFNENIYYFEDEDLKNKFNSLHEKSVLVGGTFYYTDMGSSFNDFFKRAKNLGKGIYSFQNKKKIISLLLIDLVIISMFFNQFFLIMYYFISIIFWFWVSESVYIAILAPFFWILKKLISGFYLIKYMIKKN